MMSPLLTLVFGASFVSVQVGSFSEETRAVTVVEELRGDGLDAYFLRVPSAEGDGSTYKVRVGKFKDATAARATAEKIKGLGYPGAFPQPTDLAETQGLSADLTHLVGALGSVNPGRISPEGDGRRLLVYVQDYLTLFLLAADGDPGKRVSDLAVWDTNPDNQPEIFAVVDGTRAYALFWVKTESRYALTELHQGPKLSLSDVFDLTPGPEKFVALRYELGGDLYKESGLRLYRWVQADGNFTEVGRIPLEVADRGEEPGRGMSRRRTVEAADLDADRDRELLVKCSVDVGAKSDKEHVDVWDWNGSRIERVTKQEWFEKVLSARPDDATAADGLFGLGIERGLEGDLEGAQKVFQALVSNHPQFEVSKRALTAIKQIGERRERAQVLNQTGFDEIRAGAPDLAEQDLEAALELDPGNVAAHYNLAVARTAQGDSAGALRALKRALEIDRDDVMKIREKARADGDLAALRDHPQFKEVLR